MKKRLLCILVLCPLLLCTGCHGGDPAPADVLAALTEAEIGLPAGQIYLSSASQEDAAFLPPDLISALYGEGELPWQLSQIKDYGLFLSTAQHPCEFAVFRTYAHSDTDDVAAMCHARLDALRVHYKDSQYAAQNAAHTAAQYAHYLQQARVVVIDNYVLLLISADAEHALRAAKGVI